MSSGARQVGLLTLFGVGYFAAILAGHALSFEALRFATFWPAAGILAATIALTPRHRWWKYLLVSSLINFSVELLLYQQSVHLTLVFLLANGLEGLLVGSVLHYFAGGVFQFAKMRDVLMLAAASLAVPLLGAAIGAAGLSANSADAIYWRMFQLWWQADSIGILIIAPVHIAMAARFLRLEPQPSFIGYQRVAEAIVLFILLNITTWFSFSGYADSPVWNLIGLLYLVPALAWAGLRFCRLGAAIASCNTVLIIIYHTTQGEGMFARVSEHPELQALSLQAFALVTMLTPLLFATTIDDQRSAEDKLRHNLSILQSVMDNTTDLIYIKDMSGRYLLVNRACAENARIAADQIIGKRDVDFASQERGDEIRQRDQLVYAAGRALTFEERGTFRGRSFSLLTTKSPYRDAQGKIVGLVGISRDISKLIEQVEALAESERRYRTLVTSSNVGIYETDREGVCLYVNPCWTELTGLQPEQGAGNGWANAIHPEDREKVAGEFSEAVRTGNVFSLEYRYQRPDGQITWVYGTAVPIKNDQNEVTGYLGNVVDITSQKLAVIELQLSEERFRRMSDSAPVLIWTTTLEGRISYCNRAWLQFTGRTLNEELGHGWLDCVHPDDRRDCVAAYTNAERGRSEVSLEYRLRRADGEYRWMHHTGAPKLSSNGGLRGFIGTCYDITDQRRATETLLRAKEELELHVAERTAALQEANEQLQQLLVEQARAEERLQQQQGHLAHVSRLSVMGEMAAGLAHELNQPLFAIQNYTAGILRRWTCPADCRPELREVIQQIAQESTRAAVIIRRVREFARKQLGERVSVPLNTVVTQVLQLLGSELRSSKVAVQLALADDLPPVNIDQVQIQQVLVNLLRNAVEAMDGLPSRLRRLSITTFLEQGEIHCLVQDTGPGITAAVRARLFEPFFTTKPEGLGMGLSISRSIVEAHGGRLQAEAQPTGATFHFSIPLLEDQADVARLDHTDRVLGG